jgi:hypothetical protein
MSVSHFEGQMATMVLARLLLVDVAWWMPGRGDEKSFSSFLSIDVTITRTITYYNHE